MEDYIMKRNVLVIICDQLRKDFMPMYGGTAIDTPVLDEMASEGTVFDQCITQSPVCAPARASIMTGRYVSDHGVWTNDVPFREGLEYLPQRMNEAGYMTGAFGKLHHTPGRDTKGFKEAILMEENRLKDQDDYMKFLKSKYADIEGIFQVDRSNNQFMLEDEDYYEHFLADNAIEFMLANKDCPTFTYLSFQGPHGPYDPPKRWRGKVRREALPRPIVRPNDDFSETARYRSVLNHLEGDLETIMDDREAYAEMIMEIDYQIGRVIDSLKEAGLYESTTIMFTADHGDMIGDMKLNQKGPMIYEPQLGIPMLISNHPDVEKGERSDLLVGNIDIGGTALHVATDHKALGYSKSMIKLLSGELKRSVNYSEFCDSIRIVSDAQYRFCYYPFENYCELYDRTKDPLEVNNLSGDPDYMQIENKFLKEVIDHMLISKGTLIEAQDLVPSKKASIEEKFPAFLEDYKIVFPLSSKKKYKRLIDAGLDADYNAFCKDREIIASYGRYWEEL